MKRNFRQSKIWDNGPSPLMPIVKAKNLKKLPKPELGRKWIEVDVNGSPI